MTFSVLFRAQTTARVSVYLMRISGGWGEGEAWIEAAHKVFSGWEETGTDVNLLSPVRRGLPEETG